MRLFALPLAVALLASPSFSQKPGAFAGKWDLTIATPKATYSSWIEVVINDGSPEVHVQPRGGSVHPAAGARMDDTHLIVTVSKASGNRPEVTWELTAFGDRLKGTQKSGDTVSGQVTGERAPLLDRKPPKAWTKPEPLFNGKDLTGWEPDNPAINHWVARNGALLDETKGANLKTTRKFQDFKLHIELNCPDQGNSGVYLRGRYEMQVEYEPAGIEDGKHSMGSIYGVLAPKVEMPRKPGQWESFDITLVGRRVTIVRDGTTIIDNQVIPGITGGALDSREAAPGPFYLQGDHTGGMMYRNITVSVPKK